MGQDGSMGHSGWKEGRCRIRVKVGLREALWSVPWVGEGGQTPQPYPQHLYPPYTACTPPC